MSDETEARMWDEERAPMFDPPAERAFYESSFASTEHLDRAPLLDDSFTEVTVATAEPTEHCHWKPRGEPEGTAGQLVAAIVLCAVFMVCELIGGYLAGSLSVMSDAAHMLSDCGGFVIALIALKCAKRTPDAKLSYGYKRVEILGAMVSILLIWLLTGIFVYMACVRLYSNVYDMDADAMLVVSSCGVAFNIVLAAVLHGCSSGIAHHHTHGGAACTHGHSHTHAQIKLTNREKRNGLINGDWGSEGEAGEKEEGVKARNINIRAAFIHVIGDLIQSCGVLLAAIIIKIYPSAMYVDPLCTFVFAIIVFATTVRVARDAVLSLAQAVPRGFPYRSLVNGLNNIRGVRHVHSVHVWPLSTHHVVMSAHVAIDDLTEVEAVLKACQTLVRTTYRVENATFQIEKYTPEMARCATCRYNTDR